MKHLFTQSFSRRTIKDVNTIRKVTSIKVYLNESNSKRISFTDIEVIKYHRSRKIKLFFETYSCKKKFTLLEYVIDHTQDIKLDRFFFALKKSLKENGSELLGYIRLVDIGKLGNIHHHIVVAIPKIDVKGKTFPNHLKRTFNNNVVHGGFVKNYKKLMNYYIPKEIIDLGLRKRTFAHSRKYNELKITCNKNDTCKQKNKFQPIKNILQC
jgi:hypothetical protein